MSPLSGKRRSSKPLKARGRACAAASPELLDDPQATLRHFYNSASVMMGTVELSADDILHISDNQATATFFGTTPEAMQGRSARTLGVPAEYLELWLQAYRASATSAAPVRFDYHHQGKGWLKVTVDYIGLHQGRPRFLYVVDDISDRKRMEQALREARTLLEARVSERTAQLEQAKAALEAANRQLQYDAFHDALTGLPNRSLFTDRLQHAIGRYRDASESFAALFIDLDHFKVINDSLGHPTGDALLVAVSERLLACVRTADTVARFGGDEFTVLLESCDATCAAQLATRVGATFAQPFSVQGRSFTLSASIGVVVAQQDHRQPQEVLRDADLAMYRAKVHRSGRYELFTPDMRAGALRRLELEADLRVALDQQALEVYFQPIVRLSDRRLVGFEALARWRHPQRGLLTPADFIPLAEETGLAVRLDRHMLKQACRQFGLWQAEFSGLTELSLNVNLSSQQFLHQGLAQQVEHALLQSDLSPRQLNLEITESLLMHPGTAVDEVVAQLVALGVGLCLDDFGTGYASLSYLRRFPATGLKIDRSFVQDLSEKSASLVAGMIMMGQKLGMRVVAEGVETEAQVAQLLELGCDHAQGYLFAKPLSAEQAHPFIASTLAKRAHET